MSDGLLEFLNISTPKALKTSTENNMMLSELTGVPPEIFSTLCSGDQYLHSKKSENVKYDIIFRFTNHEKCYVYYVYLLGFDDICLGNVCLPGSLQLLLDK